MDKDEKTSQTWEEKGLRWKIVFSHLGLIEHSLFFNLAYFVSCLKVGLSKKFIITKRKKVNVYLWVKTWKELIYRLKVLNYFKVGTK